MLTVLAMLILLLVGGWLDSRLNWRQATERKEE
jgi:hypothetical protein